MNDSLSQYKKTLSMKWIGSIDELKSFVMECREEVV